MEALILVGLVVALVRKGRGRGVREISMREHLREERARGGYFRGRRYVGETLTQKRARHRREAAAAAAANANAQAPEPTAAPPPAPPPRDTRGYSDRYHDDRAYNALQRRLTGNMGAAPWSFRAEVADTIAALRALVPRPSVDTILSDAHRGYIEERSPWSPNDLPGTILAVWAEQGGD